MAWGRLALIQAADDAQALDKLAEVFGYARKPEHSAEFQLVVGGFTAEISSSDETEDTAPKRPPARFLRINKMIQNETDRSDFQKPSYLSDPSRRLQASTGTYRFAPPPPLLPIARLLPLLFNSLAQARTGHSLDHRPLLKRLAQGRALQRLPKRQHQRWPQRLQIIVDADRRLEPYWTDFEFIVRQLQALLGKEAVEAFRFDKDTLGDAVCYCLPWPADDHEQWRIWQAPPPDVAILILSDLGVGDSRAAVAWRRQLAALQQHPGPILTLSPASGTSEDKAFCQQFKPNPVNDDYPLPRHPVRSGFSLGESSASAIEDILTWLSPLSLIDTGLLRRLRIALQWGDSAVETVIWNHPAVRDIGLGICLQQHLAKVYQQGFQQRFAGTEAAARFWDIVEDHHKAAYQGLRQLEKLKQCLFEHKDEATMCEYFENLCATGMNSGSDPAQQHALRLQCRTVLASLPDAIWNSELKALAYPLYATAYEDEIRAGQWPERIASGFNPDHLRWVTGDAPTAQAHQWWQIVQLDDQGQIKVEPCRLDNVVAVNTFKIEAKYSLPRLTLSDAGQETRLLQGDMTVTLAENTTAVFASGGLTVELEAVYRPSWASRIWRNAEGLWGTIPWLNQALEAFWQASTTEANGAWRWPSPFGEDAFGLYVDLSIKSVTQRFRWIEPGSFWMGSPNDEPEREWYGSEAGQGTETLHHVTLTQGFWLADTTVSQAFWLAVMGDNPSQFNDNLQNPVEKVSWHDAQRFIDRLNSLLPCLKAQLPTEAQWEYACRAGASTPFSFGANITPEQVNYNGNCPYADGREGLYREQTVPVRSLPANPWGLYEMHGNIWEWCADDWQQQLSAESVIDPLYTSSYPGAYRVVRGGSWYNYGRSVRSADRYRGTPDDRDDNLGFRLALGHVEQAVATSGDPGRRVAEHRQTGPSPVADSRPVSNPVSRLKK